MYECHCITWQTKPSDVYLSICLYTTSQKVLNKMVYIIFLSLLLTMPAFILKYCIFLFKITVFYFNIFQNVIFSCDFKAGFLASLFQSQDPSEIIITFWFAAQKTFIIISIMLKTAQ